MEKELFVMADDKCTAIVDATDEVIRDQISRYICDRLYGEIKTKGLMYMYMDDMTELVMYDSKVLPNGYIHVGYINMKLNNLSIGFLLDMSKSLGYNISCIKNKNKSISAVSLYVNSLDEWCKLFSMDIFTDTDYKQIHVLKELLEELVNFDPIVVIQTENINKPKTRSLFPNTFGSTDKYLQICWDIRSLETQNVIKDKFKDFGVNVWEGYNK